MRISVPHPHWVSAPSLLAPSFSSSPQSSGEVSPLPPIQRRQGETLDVSHTPCTCQSGGNPHLSWAWPSTGLSGSRDRKEGCWVPSLPIRSPQSRESPPSPTSAIWPRPGNHRNWSRLVTQPPPGPVSTFHVPGVNAWLKDGHNHIRIIKANLRILLELLERKSSFSWG